MPIELSLVVPAYNEARRLPPYLATVKEYLRCTFENCHEVIVVDDGSNDALEEALRPLTSAWPMFRMLHHERNLGKGAAVRAGFLAARGRLVLFADADGATPIQEEGKLRQAINAGATVAVGSRYLPLPKRARVRTWYRAGIGRLFAIVARLLFGLTVCDTQCGFKMVRGDAGRRLAGLGRETGYLFDLELLIWACRLGYPVAEIPVAWHEVPGSKLRLVHDGPALLAGLSRLICRSGTAPLRPHDPYVRLAP